MFNIILAIVIIYIIICIIRAIISAVFETVIAALQAIVVGLFNVVKGIIFFIPNVIEKVEKKICIDESNTIEELANIPKKEFEKLLPMINEKSGYKLEKIVKDFYSIYYFYGKRIFENNSCIWTKLKYLTFSKFVSKNRSEINKHISEYEGLFNSYLDFKETEINKYILDNIYLEIFNRCVREKKILKGYFDDFNGLYKKNAKKYFDSLKWLFCDFSGRYKSYDDFWENNDKVKNESNLLKKEIMKDVEKEYVRYLAKKTGMFTIDEFVYLNQEHIYEYLNLPVLDCNSEVTTNNFFQLPEGRIIKLYGETYDKYFDFVIRYIDDFSIEKIQMENGMILYICDRNGFMVAEQLVLEN